MHPVKVLQEFGTRKIWQKSSIPHSLKARPAPCSTLLTAGAGTKQKGYECHENCCSDAQSKI